MYKSKKGITKIGTDEEANKFWLLGDRNKVYDFLGKIGSKKLRKTPYII